MDEYADPEMSYRRGYQHGAWELFVAIDAFLPAAIATQVREWILRDLREWRLKNLRGEATRPPDSTPTADLAQPPLQLRR